MNRFKQKTNYISFRLPIYLSLTTIVFLPLKVLTTLIKLNLKKKRRCPVREVAIK
jgi:hypothetical protein